MKPGPPENIRSRSYGRVLVERLLGKKLDTRHVVHHIDLNNCNNDISNLVVCEDKSYHMLLHKRTEALRVTGNANSLYCKYCKCYDDPKNLTNYKGKGGVFHRKCKAVARLSWPSNRKETANVG